MRIVVGSMFEPVHDVGRTAWDIVEEHSLLLLLLLLLFLLLAMAPWVLL